MSNDVCYKVFVNADENCNNLLEYSEALKKMHIVAKKAQRSVKESGTMPKLVLNNTFN